MLIFLLLQSWKLKVNSRERTIGSTKCHLIFHNLPTKCHQQFHNHHLHQDRIWWRNLKLGLNLRFIHSTKHANEEKTKSFECNVGYAAIVNDIKKSGEAENNDSAAHFCKSLMGPLRKLSSKSNKRAKVKF